MRILFMGTSSFAVPSLESLIQSKHQVIAVVTQPDRPSGRGRQVRHSPIKEVALRANLPVHQPETVRSEDFVALVTQMAPDAFVVAAFAQIIPKTLLDIPEFGSVNVHASLLPKYRGAAPVHHALFNGESYTGVSTMLQDPGLDTGPVLLQRRVDILPDDNQGTLESRLATVGAELLVETLDGLTEGSITPKAQDDRLATRAPSVRKEHCEIDWSCDAASIVNLVRGCTPRPGAYTVLAGASLKIWACRKGTSAQVGKPGEVLDAGEQGLVVQAGDGTVLLTEVQPENRRRMTAGEFARGRHLHKSSARL